MELWGSSTSEKREQTQNTAPLFEVVANAALPVSGLPQEVHSLTFFFTFHLSPDI